jgi:EAL domain-containing protein (putative c-di-GMP-specific phosphodiesterase class I)
MDIADWLLALSAGGCGAAVVVSDLACVRVRDTVMLLASSLGLPVCVASGVPTLASLQAALAEVERLLAQDTQLRRGPQLLAPQPDAPEIRSGLLRGEFELHYQPKISLTDYSLRGVEALLRWNHPRHGLLSPASFLHRAEEGGLVDLLTMKVLQLALADCQAWSAQGLRVPVSVNLSPLALTNVHLAAQIIDTVGKSGVPPSRITFEITEYSEIGDLATALHTLLKLRLQGHRLSLDDYGAGHASVLQLSRIPFSEMKIDQRLVHGAWKRPHLDPLLRQAIGSARELGIVSVAEGIECWDDWLFMRSLGCDLAQGYLIARPMPAARLPGWRLDRRQWRKSCNDIKKAA